MTLLTHLTMPLAIHYLKEQQVLAQKVAGMALDMTLLVKEYLYVDMDINLFTLLLKAAQLHFIEYKKWGLLPTFV